MRSYIAVCVFVCVALSARAHERHEPLPSRWEDVEGWNRRLEVMDVRRQSLAAVLASAADPSAEKCQQCYEVVTVVEELLFDKRSFEFIELIADTLCSRLFVNDTLLQAVCEKIPGAVRDIIQYGVGSGASVQSIVCADFAHMCTQPCCLQPRAPEQIHLAYASNVIAGPQVSIRVAWSTLENVTDSLVRWKAWNASGWSTAVPETATYTVGGWIGTLYFAVMPDLPPATTLTYQVGSDRAEWSTQFNFTTLPLDAGTVTRPLRILGVADLGYDVNGKPSLDAMQRLVSSGAVDLIVHPGDVGYADADQHRWDEFMRELQPIAAVVPYMTGPGNHECIWYNCTAYKARFRMPAAGLGAPADALYYALHAPNASLSIVMLNSETWYDTANVGPVQRAWAERTLSTSTAVFKFVMHHRPLYCSSTSSDCNEMTAFLRSQVELMYRDQGVGAVMCGHVHNFERTFPVFNSTVVGQSCDNASAPVYFVNGGAGNPEGQAAFSGPIHDWSAFKTTARTFQLYSVTTEGSVVTLVASTIQPKTGEVVDEIVITRRA
jgi:hypothetical protein